MSNGHFNIITQFRNVSLPQTAPFSVLRFVWGQLNFSVVNVSAVITLILYIPF